MSLLKVMRGMLISSTDIADHSLHLNSLSISPSLSLYRYPNTVYYFISNEMPIVSILFHGIVRAGTL